MRVSARPQVRAGFALSGTLVCALLLFAGASAHGIAAPGARIVDVVDGPPGFVHLQVTAPPQTDIVVGERRGSTVVPLRRVRLAASRVVLDRVAAWTCSRQDRTFVVTATFPDGTVTQGEASVTTPSCATRVSVRVPRIARAGSTLPIRLRDRWLVGGVGSRICATPPGGVPACKTIMLAAQARPRELTVRARRTGRWTVRITTHGATQTKRVIVRPRGGRLRLLTIGDSEMQLLDEFIAGSLRSRGVRLRQVSDARISTGLSNSFLFDWPPHARRLARTFRPDVSVVFLGANDGYPLPSAAGRRVPCCSKPWVRAYARRASEMMASMLRQGRGRVYWVLLPVARDRETARFFRGVNAGIRLAAATRHGEVRLIDTNATFAPDGTYRTTLTDRGRQVTVREPDGYHLSVGGSRILARLLSDAMSDDGVTAGS